MEEIQWLDPSNAFLVQREHLVLSCLSPRVSKSHPWECRRLSTLAVADKNFAAVRLLQLVHGTPSGRNTFAEEVFEQLEGHGKVVASECCVSETLHSDGDVVVVPTSAPASVDTADKALGFQQETAPRENFAEAASNTCHVHVLN